MSKARHVHPHHTGPPHMIVRTHFPTNVLLGLSKQISQPCGEIVLRALPGSLPTRLSALDTGAGSASGLTGAEVWERGLSQRHNVPAWPTASGLLQTPIRKSCLHQQDLKVVKQRDKTEPVSYVGFHVLDL